MRPFYSLAKIREMRATIARDGYSVPRGYHLLSDEQVQEVANGIGPGAWSRSGRKLSTWLQPHAEIPALLHDIGYCRPDKTPEAFREENDRFLENLRRSVRLRMSAWNPLRVVVFGVCYLEYLAVRNGGWSAFVVGRTFDCLGPDDEGPECAADETELYSGKTEDSA